MLFSDKKFPIPKTVKKFALKFKEHGFLLYVVGGAVRDYLLNIENHDFDFCTDALPEQVQKIFHCVIPTGIKHGTVTVLFEGNSFEVTTFRTESDYSDSRHPDKVTFVRNLSEDLSRRDFTINAFAADCTDGKITDLFNGKADLKNKIIRAIGNPTERFQEDALRLMRMARFCSKLGFLPDENTKKAAKNLASSILNVSSERICDEIFKILGTKKPSYGLTILQETGILDFILPELAVCKNIEQTKLTAKNVLEHILIAVDAAAQYNYSLNVRIALLLHDIGKTETKTINEYGIMRFPKHEIVGSEIAVHILKRLKCSNETINKTKILIENHMVKYQNTWTDGAVKRFINRVGKENIDELFELQWCDQIASEGKSKINQYDEFIQRINTLQHEPLSLKDLAITGTDLIQAGIPAGKEMGLIMKKLLDMVIDYPTLNNKQILIEQSLTLYKSITT